MKASVTIGGKRYDISVRTSGAVDSLEFYINGIQQFVVSPSENPAPKIPLTEPLPLTGTMTVEFAYEPTSYQVAAYLEGLIPDMTHTLASIAEKFLKRRISPKNEPMVYNRLFQHVRTAQRMLEVKYGGRFVRKKILGTDIIGRHNTFTKFTFRPSAQHLPTVTSGAHVELSSEPIVLAEKSVPGGIQR